MTVMTTSLPPQETNTYWLMAHNSHVNACHRRQLDWQYTKFGNNATSAAPSARTGNVCVKVTPFEPTFDDFLR